MLAAQDVAQLCKDRGITALHIKLRATGGTRYIIILSYIPRCNVDVYILGQELQVLVLRAL